MSLTPIQQIERTRNILSFLLVGAFISVLPVLTFKAIPEANEQIITYMVGQLSGMATMALGFYFVNKVGADAADAIKSENTGKLAEAITATAQAAKGSDTRAGEAADEVAAAAVNEAGAINRGEKP